MLAILLALLSACPLYLVAVKQSQTFIKPLPTAEALSFLRSQQLTKNAHCPDCQTKITGHFAAFGKPFGARRIPIAIK
jgi:hypothetical protein